MAITKIGETVFVKEGTTANPRNTEGAFLELKDHSLMYAFGCYEKGSDWGRSTISAIFSHDGGITWGGERVLLRMEDDGLSDSEPSNPQNITSVSLLRLANGDVGLFYGIRRSWNDTHLHLRRSSDEAKTWSAPVSCTASSGYFVTSNDRVTKLASGRLVVPAAYHRVKQFPDKKKSIADQIYDILDFNAHAMFFISDDDGRSWHENAHQLSLPVSWSMSGLQEPGVLELSNGVLWGWARTDVGRQYEMFSFDAGENWTQPEPSRQFTSPCSPMVAKRAPSGEIYAVWNPVPFTYSESFPKYGMSVCTQIRSPLVIACSRDDGKTWSPMRVVDASFLEQGGMVEYPAVYCLNDSLLVCYDITVDNRLDMVIKRIAYDEIIKASGAEEVNQTATDDLGINTKNNMEQNND